MAPADPHGDPASQAAWSGILDDMEACLVQHRRALHEGTSPPGRVTVPEKIGPLPAALRVRAESVLAETLRVEAAVGVRRQALRGALRRTALVAGREAASYVDARA